MRGTQTLLATTIALLGATDAFGQQVQSSTAISGGSATDVAGVTSRAVSLVPAVAFVIDPRLTLGVNASATRYDNQQWALGGGATGAVRLPLGEHAAFTVDGAGSLATTSYDFSYGVASLLPALELHGGPIAVFGGADLAGASTSTSTTTQSVPQSGLLGPASGPLATHSLVAAARTALGGLFGAAIHGSDATGESIALGYREEHVTVDTFPLVDRRLTLTLGEGVVSISGTAGMRDERAGHTTFGSGTLGVSVTQAVAIELNAGSYPADHLIGTPAGRFVTLGLRLRTGAPARFATITPAPMTPDGLAHLAIRADSATSVEVAGDFTNWQFVSAHRAANGEWVADMKIAPGRYRYAFRIDGRDWRVPSNAARAEDDLGGPAAWLVVQAPSIDGAR